MLHYIFVCATWLIGTLGVVGAAAAVAGTVFLGPAAMMAIVQPILARFITCARCVATVVFVLSTVGAYWVGHHGEYGRGHKAALAEIAAEDSAAIGRATEMRKTWRGCRDRGGHWDQTEGTCS